jgi:dTMP kinase
MISAAGGGGSHAGTRPDSAASAGSVARVAGLFVTFEGIDRAGKTTQARLLVDALGVEAVAVREPGGTAVGEGVRALVKDPSIEVGPETEALLFAAARAELVREVIRPALEAGRVVVSDRFLDSSLAYQGTARGLGVEAVARANDLATDGLVPDRTFLLVLEPVVAAARGPGRDRFEVEGPELQAAVAEGYEGLADSDPVRWRRIDAARTVGEIHAEVLSLVEEARAATAA